ncbi:MAG: ABC transporter ATP-binding protein, partial [Ferruginibacter sp.]|nr:ABC transporter ATP-binding protein [Ferruginibacter sp.]
ELSGGQRQRVMIAMAIATNPVLLIADEPTTALDVRVQAGIVELIKRLQQKQGMSVLFITHDLGLLADMADEVMVMRKGEIVETGPAQRVLLNPMATYTKALLSCRPAANPPQTRLPEMDAGKNQEFHTSYPPAKQDTNSTPLLEVHNLEVEVKDSHTHLKKRILGPVSFEIQEGETLGLVGESGCGKTTLGKAIIGLLPKSGGNILFRGQNPDELTATNRRNLTAKIQMVFQDPFGSLDPRITIGKALLEPLVVHHIGGTEARRKEMVQDMLRKVKLSSDHFNRYPHEFSGGQRQRICIARALVLQPRLLIFDESVSALDVSVQASILNLIAELRGQLGFSALFISHDLSVIHHICNRIMVMQNGLVTETGTASEVFAHPRKPYTQKLIAAIPGKSLK